MPGLRRGVLPDYFAGLVGVPASQIPLSVWRVDDQADWAAR